jgi:hypothetical protein
MAKFTTTLKTKCINVQQTLSTTTVRLAITEKDSDKASVAVVLQFDTPKAAADYAANEFYTVVISKQ